MYSIIETYVTGKDDAHRASLVIVYYTCTCFQIAIENHLCAFCLSRRRFIPPNNAFRIMSGLMAKLE